MNELGLAGFAEQSIFAALVGLMSIVCIRRGLQYGLVLAMFAGIMQFTLISGMGALPLVTMDRLVWPIVLLKFFIEWMRGKTEKLSLDWVEYALLALIAVILVSMYFSDSTFKAWSDRYGVPEKIRLRPFLNGFFYPFVAYFIARRAIRTEQQISGFFVAVGFVIIYLVLTGLGEATGVHWLVFPKFIIDPNKGIHFGFVRGPFLNASQYGLALAMGLPIVLWLFFTERRVRSPLWFGITMLAAVPLIFSYQRSAWLGAAMALGAVAMAWPKRRVVLVVGLALGASISLLAVTGTVAEKRLTARLQAQNTVDYRVELMKKSVELVRENLVMGVGFYRFREAVGEIAEGGTISHNTPLTLFAELGLLGFIPYCSVFIFWLIKSMTAYLLRPQSRPLIIILWGITAAYFVSGFTGDLRIVVYANTLIFALWGMILEQIRRPPGLREDRFVVHQRVVSFA